MNSMIKFFEPAGSVSATKRFFRKQSANILALAVLLSVGLFSCEEDPANIGRDILPGSDFDSIVGVDTIGTEMYTLYSDSASSMNPANSFLGTSLDPYFGVTSSDFVSQLWLASRWNADGLRIDSAMLTLQVTEVVGDMSNPGVLNIYEIDEKLSSDSTYQISRDVPVAGLLASLQLPSLPSGEIDTVLTLDLPLSMAEYILRDTAALYLRSDTSDFRDYFKGLYFEYPQSDNYHMLELNVKGSGSNIYVYYTNTDTLDRQFALTMNEKCVIYNRYSHDFEQADPDKMIKYINEPVRDTLAYAQSKYGVFTSLALPGLEGLRDRMPIAVNKARLYLPAYINTDDYSETMIPDNLLVRYDSAGVKRILTDYLINPAFLDGTYDKVDNQFVVNIASFVQQYLDGDIIDPVIEIYLPEQSNKNLIIKANRDDDTGPRFELTYTVY